MGMALSKEDTIRKYLSDKYSANNGGTPFYDTDESMYSAVDPTAGQLAIADNETPQAPVEDLAPAPEAEAESQVEAAPAPSPAPMPTQKADEDVEDVSDVNTSDKDLPDLPKDPEKAEDIAKSLDKKREAINAALQAKFGQIGNSDAVRQAQADQQSNNNTANIFQALEGFARANSMAHGGAGVNSGFYQALRDQGAQGVKNAVTNRQALIQSYVTQNALTNEAVQQEMAKGKYSVEQAKANVEAAKNDGESTISKLTVQSYQSLGPPYSTAIKKGMSAAQADDVMKGVEIKAKTDENALTRKTQLGFQQDRINQQRDLVESQNANKDFISLKNDVDFEGASKKKGLGAAQSKIDDAGRVMAYAGISPSQIEAAKNDPQAQAALIQKLNKMPIEEAASVMGGLASQLPAGSVPVKPGSNLNETIAHSMEFLKSAPAQGNQGALLFNSLDKLKGQYDYNQNILTARMDQMRKFHPKAFSNSTTKDAAEALLSTRQPSESSNAVSNSGPAMVKMVGADGKRYSVPQENVQAAKNNGWSEINSVGVAQNGQ